MADKNRFSLVMGTSSGAIEALQDVDESALARLIVHVLQMGAGISLAITKDFSSVSITVHDGGSKSKFYATSTDELEKVIEQLDTLARSFLD